MSSHFSEFFVSLYAIDNPKGYCYLGLDEKFGLKNVFIPKLGYTEENHKYLINELIQWPKQIELNLD